MGGICFCGCECQSENPFVCFGSKLTTKGLRARSQTRPEEDEGRKVPETVGMRGQSREKNTVSRWEQQRPADRTGQSRDESRAGKRPVNRSQKGDC